MPVTRTAWKKLYLDSYARSAAYHELVDNLQVGGTHVALSALIIVVAYQSYLHYLQQQPAWSLYSVLGVFTLLLTVIHDHITATYQQQADNFNSLAKEINAAVHRDDASNKSYYSLLKRRNTLVRGSTILTAVSDNFVRKHYVRTLQRATYSSRIVDLVDETLIHNLEKKVLQYWDPPIV